MPRSENERINEKRASPKMPGESLSLWERWIAKQDGEGYNERFWFFFLLQSLRHATRATSLYTREAYSEIPSTGKK